jgi:carboxyl-terminal processing protease
MVRDVPKMPPENWPTYDPTKPETDFQLQQGLGVLRAMPVSAHAAR